MQTIDRVGSGQTRARYPDSEGYVERDGVRVHYEVFGSGATDGAAAPDLGDRPFACVEDAGAVPRAAFPRDHLRRARERPVGPAGGAGGVRRGRVCGRRDRGPRRHGDRTDLRGRSLDGRPARTDAGGRPSGPGRGRRLHRACDAVRGPDAAGTGRDLVRRRAGLLRGMGQVQPPLLAERLRRLPVLLLLADLHRAALDQADRGLHRLGSADHSGDADRDARRHVRRGDRAGARRARPLSRAGDPRPRGRGPLAGVGRHACRADGRRHGRARGLRACAACPRPGEGQPAPARFRLARAAGRPLGARPVTPQAGPVHLVADRARPRPARRRDRRRAPGAAPRARDRLARSASGHRGARGPRRAHPPGECRPGERIAPHRVGVGGARPPLLPGLAADGRDPVRELHGLPRPRSRLPVRPLDRRRGLGARLLPARESGAEVGCLRLAHGLRRLAADAGRRRARGAADGGLQRGDDRAHRALSPAARPGDLRRRRRGRRPRRIRPRAAADPRLDGAALRVRRLRDRVRPRGVRRPRAAPRRARVRRRRAGLCRHGRRLGRRRRPAAPRDLGVPGGETAGAGPADDRRRRARASTRRRCRRTTDWRSGPTSTTSTASWRPATSPSSRAG